jgi:hypothetical protein
MMAAVRKRTLWGHPLAAFGGALVVAGGAAFLIMVLMDITSGTDNPYRSLVTFIIIPFIITMGGMLFGLSILIQMRAARRRGEEVKFNFSIDPSNQRYMRNLWLFLGFLGVLVFVMAYSGSKAYEATDSVAFCGEMCHPVMEPQNVTYRNSPHARVPCVACHIGPGASFYVKSKFDGIRQLYYTFVGTYPRPIETPVQSLRPAQETCEGCHWPQQFYGKKLVSRTYYRTDEENSPWSIDLLMKIGGGNPRTGKQEGIHWHMLTENRVEYIATDSKRQVIPWIRRISPAGDTIVYADPDADPIDPTNPEYEIRKFDCMDCHNRPSHEFPAPANALNLALSTRDISPGLPYIRQLGLDLLNAEYETREKAHDAISFGARKYYEDNYPELADSLRGSIQQATQSLIKIYDEGFFPEMKTDYRARENNLSHFVNDGCFRCHDGIKEDSDGNKLSTDCRTCHLIVAQGPSENPEDLESDIAGLDFKHPEDIDEAWQEMLCTECHTPESGY